MMEERIKAALARVEARIIAEAQAQVRAEGGRRAWRLATQRLIGLEMLALELLDPDEHAAYLAAMDEALAEFAAETD